MVHEILRSRLAWPVNVFAIRILPPADDPSMPTKLAQRALAVDVAYLDVKCAPSLVSCISRCWEIRMDNF